MSKHPTSIPGFDSMQELADTVENLRYDSLREFLWHLSRALLRRSLRDAGSGRRKLAGLLLSASVDVQSARHHVAQAWEVCEPYMEDAK
jgi:hypothetical protein